MTIGSLVRCAEREERLRREYYPRRVETGKMTQEQMDHEVACMGQIVSILRNMLPAPTPPALHHDEAKPLGEK